MAGFSKHPGMIAVSSTLANIAPEYRPCAFSGVICLNCAMALNGHSAARPHTVVRSRRTQHEAKRVSLSLSLSTGRYSWSNGDAK